MLDINGKNKLDMMVLVNDEAFDNDDNPFGKFILHLYTNMQDLNDTDVDIEVDSSGGGSLYKFEDREVPLVKCPVL